MTAAPQNLYPQRISTGWVTCTIYRVVNNKQWITYCVTIRTPDNPRERTTFSDPKEALEFARRRVAELKQIGPDVKVSQKKLDYYRNCERKLGEIPLDVAVDKFLRLSDSLGSEILDGLVAITDTGHLRRVRRDLLAQLTKT